MAKDKVDAGAGRDKRDGAAQKSAGAIPLPKAPGWWRLPLVASLLTAAPGVLYLCLHWSLLREDGGAEYASRIVLNDPGKFFFHLLSLPIAAWLITRALACCWPHVQGTQRAVAYVMFGVLSIVAAIVMISDLSNSYRNREFVYSTCLTDSARRARVIEFDLAARAHISSPRAAAPVKDAGTTRAPSVDFESRVALLSDLEKVLHQGFRLQSTPPGTVPTVTLAEPPVGDLGGWTASTNFTGFLGLALSIQGTLGMLFVFLSLCAMRVPLKRIVITPAAGDSKGITAFERLADIFFIVFTLWIPMNFYSEFYQRYYTVDGLPVRTLISLISLLILWAMVGGMPLVIKALVALFTITTAIAVAKDPKQIVEVLHVIGETWDKMGAAMQVGMWVFAAAVGGVVCAQLLEGVLASRPPAPPGGPTPKQKS